MNYSCVLCVIASVALTVRGTPIQVGGDEWEEDMRREGANQKLATDNLSMPSSSKDQKSDATGYGHGGHGFDGLGHGHGVGHGNSKYFQYAHNPDYGHYEFGYRRGNDHHFQERYEKAHDWKFKTKVKWGDKYGGYGEHYYDYNHADGYGGDHGDHGDHGHDGGYDGGSGHGHYSEQVPVVTDPKAVPKHSHGGGLKKRESKRPATKVQGTLKPKTKLSLDHVSGKVTDERTGHTYWLQPTPT